MNKTTMAVLGLLTCQGLVVQSAHANDEGYVGLRLGYSSLSGEACTLGSPCDDDSVGGGLYGGYDFSQYFALEGGLDLLGDFKTNLGADKLGDGLLKAVSLTPKFSFPVSEELDLFAKIGGAYLNYDGDNDVVPTGSLGLEYQFAKEFAARLEYQRYQGFSDSIVDDLDVNFFALGISYLYGAMNDDSVTDVEPRPTSVEEEPAAPVIEPKTAVMKKQQKQLFDQGTFELSSATLSDSGMQTLKPLRDLLVAHPYAKAQIVGHTDSSGSEEFNQTLSEARAQAVADFLVEGGVNPEQLTIEGDGEKFPIATNDTKEGRAQNRRVEVTIPSFEYDEM
jgi:OOP family OmpA-OmpF porin